MKASGSELVRTKSELEKECARVNIILRAEAKAMELGTKKSLARLAQNANDVVTFKYWALLEFREYARRQIEQHQSVSATGLIANGSRLLGLSPVTVKRYLVELRAENGPLSGMGDIVVLNPRYVPAADDPYWEEE